MTDLKNFAPIQISTLKDFENLRAYYFLIGYDVVNTITGHKEKFPLHKRNCPYVILEPKDDTPNKKCLLNRLLDLAYPDSENGNFDLVEHLDDNSLNYNINNFKFSYRSENGKRAFENGSPNRIDKIFEVKMNDGKIFTGTIKELSHTLKIQRQTLYCRYYEQTSGRKIQSVTLFENSNDRSTD